MMGKKGLSHLEYAVLMAAVSVALVSASVYFKRGIEGKWKAGADTFGFGGQYDAAQSPSATTPAFTTTVAVSPGTSNSADYTTTVPPLPTQPPQPNPEPTPQPKQPSQQSGSSNPATITLIK